MAFAGVDYMEAKRPGDFEDFLERRNDFADDREYFCVAALD